MNSDTYGVSLLSFALLHHDESFEVVEVCISNLVLVPKLMVERLPTHPNWSPTGLDSGDALIFATLVNSGLMLQSIKLPESSSANPLIPLTST